MLSAASGPVDGVTAQFLQFGVLGAVALLGLWFVLTAYRREVRRADMAETELRTLNREVRDKVIPALTSATQAVTDHAQLLRDRR